MFDLGCLGKVPITFGALLLQIQLLQASLALTQLRNERAFVYPLQMHGIALVLQVPQLLVQLLPPFTAGLVRLAVESLVFYVQLQDLALDLVQFIRLTLDLHLQLAGRLIHQVDGLVREETVGNVPVAQGGCSHQGLILDSNPMVHFIALLEPAQNGNRGLYRRLLGVDRLETPLQSLVRLDVLAVLIQGGRPDRVQFPAAERRLDQV